MKSYYSKETKKAIDNFGEGQLDSSLIRSYAIVKKAVLSALHESESLFNDSEFSCLIDSINEIISEQHNFSFALNIFQGGAGTSINMCINEVIAGIANEKYETITGIKNRFHPLNDINYYQSTNDTFPTAIIISVLGYISNIEKSIISLQNALNQFENQNITQVMLARTEFQSALPITLSQITSAWTGCTERDRWRFHKIKERFRTVPLGGTAVGTSFPASQKYIFAVDKYLREFSGLNLSRSQNFTDDISSLDRYSELAGIMKVLSGNIYRISSDLLLYTSSFINEFILPEHQFGSSIMPAKVNPVLLEYTSGLSINTSFECDKIIRYSELTTLQLNPYLPFIYNSIKSSSENLIISLSTLSSKIFSELTLNSNQIDKNLYSSNAMFNLLLKIIPYSELKNLYYTAKEQKIENQNDFFKFIKLNTKLSDQQIEQLMDPIKYTYAGNN